MDDMQSAILLCNYVCLFPRHDVVSYLDECTCRRTFLSSERVIILVFYSPTPLQHYKVTVSAGALYTRGKRSLCNFRSKLLFISKTVRYECWRAICLRLLTFLSKFCHCQPDWVVNS